jgi:hypothetical protein
MKEAPEAFLVPVYKASREFLHQSASASYRQVKEGKLVAREVDGRIFLDAHSFPYEAQKRWRQAVLRNAVKGDTEPAQPGLFPSGPMDEQIAALGLSRSERDVVWRRYRIVQMCLNHNWKAEGSPNLGAFEEVLAVREHTTKRNVQRWIRAWKQGENLLDLVPERPGPAPGAGAILDADMRAHLIDCWVIKKLNLRQCYRSLIKYLETKQGSPGCRVDHFYAIPSRTTVERFIRSLSTIDDAAREGADALKTAVGSIDRTYRDLPSLGRVDVDEWISDVLAYDPRHASKVGRYYVLTFLDERSLYPLVWSLVEQPNEQDEIDLLVRLIREFGIPGLINSDRGRFRGRTFGGGFLNRDRAKMYQERDGILDRLDIKRNLPREHNPRGSRLERFHKELANWARTVPGWCGSDTKQRRMTDADERVRLHKEWVRTGQGTAPLVSRDQLLERLSQFMAECRQRLSDGNDMDGFAPEAVFRQNVPTGGFRRISDEELSWTTAEYFNVLIRTGGVVQLRDGKRYSAPELLLIAGEHRQAVRLRHDHEQISVLPSAKGEDVIIAKRRARVGVNDPDQLASAMELQNRLRKDVGGMVKPLDYDPGASLEPEPPKAAQVIHPSEFIAAQEAPEPSQEISSSEWLMENDRYKKRVKPLDFADLEP